MNTVDVLKYGHQTLMGSLTGIPTAECEVEGVCGVWSVKDIVAHMTSYEQLLAEILSTFLDGGPTPHMDHMAEVGGLQFNDLQVEMRREMPLDDIVAECTAAHERVVAQAEQMPAETFRQNGTLPWYGADYDLDDFIIYTNYAHKREHSAEIGVFRDRLRAQSE